MPIPDIDDTVPTADANAKFRGRWDRKLRDGVHKAQIVEAKMGFHQAKSQDQVEISFVVEGTPETAPEGPVKIDWNVPTPPNSTYSFRNMREIFFPAKGPIADDQIESLVGRDCLILTRHSPAKGAFKAKNFVDKVLELVGPPLSAAKAAATAEPDPFDSASTSA